MTATICITGIVVWLSFGAAVALWLDPRPARLGEWIRVVLLWPLPFIGMLFRSGH